MILDMGSGYHEAQVEYLDFGWGYTWISGDSPADATFHMNLTVLIDRTAEIEAIR